MIHCDPRLCVGCRRCEVACAEFHFGAVSPTLSRIRVAKLESIGIDMSVACVSCIEKSCLICPRDALSSAEDGTILLDADPDFGNLTLGVYGTMQDLTTGQSGEYYVVEEVYLSDDGDQWWVKLTKPLRDDLWSFWVFPPAILEYNSSGPSEYAAKQPVINVTKVRLDF